MRRFRGAGRLTLIGLKWSVRPPGRRRIAASAGVATSPDHAGDARHLLDCADQVLYCAKGSGRDQTQVLDAQAVAHNETKGSRSDHLVKRLGGASLGG